MRVPKLRRNYGGGS